jgi:hypothetical protein
MILKDFRKSLEQTYKFKRLKLGDAYVIDVSFGNIDMIELKNHKFIEITKQLNKTKLL